MDGRLIRTNCDEARDYVVPNVLSPMDLVSRPDNMDEKLYYHHVIVPHRKKTCFSIFRTSNNQAQNSAYASAQSKQRRCRSMPICNATLIVVQAFCHVKPLRILLW